MYIAQRFTDIQGGKVKLLPLSVIQGVNKHLPLLCQLLTDFKTFLRQPIGANLSESHQ